MDAFLRLPPEERRLACQQVDAQMRLQAVSVEKDFWVCWTLRERFALPDIGDHLTFKGGTSLSKAWGLIQRFSEDIDLVVDKEALGFGGDAAPEKATSNNKRRERLAALMEACRQWSRRNYSPLWPGGFTPHSANPAGSSKSIPTWPTASACCSITRLRSRRELPATFVPS